MIFGKRDGHVPSEGRDLIRKTLGEKGVEFGWVEIAGAQREFFLMEGREGDGWGEADGGTDAFIRDELSKGRYDPAVSGICFQMLLELFGRTLRSELGTRAGREEGENVC